MLMRTLEVAAAAAAPWGPEHTLPELLDDPELFPAGLVGRRGLDRRGPPLDAPPPLRNPPG